MRLECARRRSADDAAVGSVDEVEVARRPSVPSSTNNYDE